MSNFNIKDAKVYVFDTKKNVNVNIDGGSVDFLLGDTKDVLKAYEKTLGNSCKYLKMNQNCSWN